MTLQVAGSLTLCVAAGLLVQSLLRLKSVSLGFAPDSVLTARLVLPSARFPTATEHANFARNLSARLEQIPGVQAASLSLGLPTTGESLGTNVELRGLTELEAAQQPTARLQSVTAGYFRTLRLPLMQGRVFNPEEERAGGPGAVLVNEAFARRFWPEYPAGPSPIGRQLREGAGRTGWLTIVGVVGDVREDGPASEPVPQFYVPTWIHPPAEAYLALRSSLPISVSASTIRAAVSAIDRTEPVGAIRPMTDLIAETGGRTKLAAIVLNAFGSMALALAALGIYGSLAFSAAQRAREMGIRRALGAGRADLIILVVRRGLLVTAAGIALGGVGSAAASRLLASLLFHVSPGDPKVFGGVTGLLLLVMASASFAPGWRTSRVDPAAVLRAQ